MQTLQTRILRLPEVSKITGLARPTIYWQVRRGLFPRQIQLGPKSVGWLESDIQAWLNERIAARDAITA